MIQYARYEHKSITLITLKGISVIVGKIVLKKNGRFHEY
jgi:hypothetical protein